MELKEFNQFDNICRDEIVQEMDRIGVNFQFWQERGANTWNHTSLMGDDKLKALKRAKRANSQVTPEKIAKIIAQADIFKLKPKGTRKSVRT